MSEKYLELQVTRWHNGQKKTLTDQIIKEIPLTIHYNEQELVTLLCTPDCWDELALGFLASEGLIKTADDLSSIKVEPQQGVVEVVTKQAKLLAEQLFLKRMITTGCGKGTTFYQAMDSALIKPLVTAITLTPEQILGLINQLQARACLYRQTGGAHSAALAQGDQVLIFREDIGRHNAVDKIFGRCLLDRIDLQDKILLTSGRISSEILLKVAKQGIAVLVSRSAPTDLSIKLAEELGITLVGFVRGKRMNIYSHHERILT